jgi:signal transduction histidine kinase
MSAETDSKPGSPPDASSGEHFEIHASVVFQLGESLITDSVQALVELVKNCYDADATFCKVNISTEPISDPASPFMRAVGSISVEDDGSGMTLDLIRRGWLTISNSDKRDFKDKTLRTGKGRTPLGDKGLGRLGTQRLGYNLEMFTRSEGSPTEHHVWFSWKDFMGQSRLSEVNINREEIQPTRKHGTTLIISQLRELNLWRGDSVKELETNLSQLISPYREVRDFVVYATVDGKELELLEVGERLRRSAQLRYTLGFDGDLLQIKGKARLAYIRPEHEPDRSLFSELVEIDNGKRFFAFLQSLKKAGLFSLEQLSDDGWFSQYKTTRYFEDLDALASVDGKPANPGPFRGEIDFFSLGVESSTEQTVFDTAAQYRQLIGKLSGIRVYRDGFGVRVAPDWLDLGKQWTKGGSYYGLKPHNTLGYIAISARDNRQLEETTDREGFRNNPYYRNFYELLRQFVEFSGQAQAFLRRGWTEFQKAHKRALAQVPDDSKPEAISTSITTSLGKAAAYSSALSGISFRLRQSVENGREAVDAMRLAGVGNGQGDRLQSNFTQLANLIAEAEDINTRIAGYLEELSQLRTKSVVLTDQIGSLREQVQQVHEIIALGLTAEALSHEIDNVTTQLAQRNQQLARYMRSNNIKETRVVNFTEYVNTAVAALRSQLQFLAPSLQYVREKREVIDVEAFVADIFKHYTMHFASTPIRVVPISSKGQHFKIEMNRGKLIQILDNIFLNSEYWLKEDHRMGRIARGMITVEVAKPYIRISDNGRGIDPTVEGSLFEPFVSAKGKGKGRGLGLYIVQQLLDSEGCTIRLLPVRNSEGRMFKFEIDLTGALLGRR